MEKPHTQHQLILPTSRLPPSLKSTKQPPTPQFLVGYRNVLVLETDGKAHWGLIKAPKHCGKAFCFQISEQEAHQVAAVAAEDELVQVMGTAYIIHKQTDGIRFPVEPLPIDEIRQLLSQIEAVDPIGMNLIKGAFDSLLEFNRVVGSQTGKKLGLTHGPQQFEMPDRVKIQIHSKKLSGQKLSRVPTIDKGTGKWSSEDTVDLQLFAN